MGQTVYNKCVKMLKGHEGKELNLQELQTLITIFCGSMQSTIKTAMQTMGMTGLIKDIGNSRFVVKNEN